MSIPNETVVREDWLKQFKAIVEAAEQLSAQLSALEEDTGRSRALNRSLTVLRRLRDQEEKLHLISQIDDLGPTDCAKELTRRVDILRKIAYPKKQSIGDKPISFKARFQIMKLFAYYPNELPNSVAHVMH